MSEKFKIELINRQGPATEKANKRYPNGIEMDVTEGRKGCVVTLPYPAEERGHWMVKCRSCGSQMLITAAGRRDDPRSLKIPCRNVLLQ